MKALSVKNPNAYDLIIGAKTLKPGLEYSEENPLVEWRSWSTEHRGLLLICASSVPREPAMFSGHALGIVEQVDCRLMRVPGSRDKAFAHLYRNPRPLLQPFPVRGQLHHFEVDAPLHQLATGYHFMEFQVQRKGRIRLANGSPVCFYATFEAVVDALQSNGAQLAKVTDQFSPTFTRFAKLDEFQAYEVVKQPEGNAEMSRYLVLAKGTFPV